MPPLTGVPSWRQRSSAVLILYIIRRWSRPSTQNHGDGQMSRHTPKSRYSCWSWFRDFLTTLAIYLFIYYKIRTTGYTNKTQCKKIHKNTQKVHYEVHKNHIIESTSDSQNSEIWPLWNFTLNSSLSRFILSRSGAITEFQSTVQRLKRLNW